MVGDDGHLLPQARHAVQLHGEAPAEEDVAGSSHVEQAAFGDHQLPGQPVVVLLEIRVGGEASERLSVAGDPDSARTSIFPSPPRVAPFT